MKRLLTLLIALLAFTPGCRKKTTKKPAATESVVLKKEPVTKDLKQKKESIFLDEDIDKFALQEEEKISAENAKEKSVPVETDMFAPADIKNNTEAVSIFEEEEAADRALDASRSAEQRKTGFKTIYFDFDKFVIRNDQLPALERDLEVVKKLIADGKSIVIEGHACRSAGSDTYNMILSEKRAQSVLKWLAKHGVDTKKIKVVGRGYELCVVLDGSREEQAPNRRVEFYGLK